ncbi:MAG TPA: L-seryl-tRNA(Sec) selenium transferase [Thermoanaerobaculia bacterium]|nr:L-seryl-tRNA(Sec) selenium transferase [Thermoanaerobaculia bacterium]
MPKSKVGDADSREAVSTAASGALRAIPSVERILSSETVKPLIAEYGRPGVKAAIAGHLDALRASREPWTNAAGAIALRERLALASGSTLRRAINATGVIIHTNLGRSPIDDGLWAEASEIVTGYSNLELDLESGERGRRDEHLAAICHSLFGCEAALLANNNAAATLLLLAAVASKKEVLVSRGELVEIGGSFRVPDVIQQGGARLREVGTTNRTRARDYADAASRKTAAILRVHRSNFEIVGFTETPTIEELVEVAHARKLPLLFDEGSGRVVDLAKYGFSPHATIRDHIATGVDVLTCSTDKLIGATQGGLILGRREIIERCRRHPLMRALRAGKESYAIIASTLRAFLAEKHEERIPIYRMLALSTDELRARAASLVDGTNCRSVDARCVLGGGTTPTETIPSTAVEVPGNANAYHQRFLHNDPPIVGRIEDDRFLFDVRTLLPVDLADVKTALQKR